MDSNIKKIIRAAFLILAALAVAPASSYADSNTGMVNVFVQDAHGVPVSKALIYISRNSKSDVIESNDKGTASIDLKEGNYTVSAMITHAGADYVERLASAEAHVNVNSQDATSIILTLHPIRSEDITLSTLKKLGIAEEVSKYTN